VVKRYQYDGPIEITLIPLGRRVQPGEVVETEIEINHPHFSLMEKPPKAAKPAKETADADN
jgi:hypothetical protein